MLLVETVERLTAWIQKHVCNEIRFKMPDTAEEIHPAAFAFFAPGKEMLPPDIPAPVPSCVVQIMAGTDTPKKGSREMDVRVSLCTWNPGVHEKELYQAYPDASSPMGWKFRYANPQESQAFQMDLDGWKDVYTFADLLISKLEQAGTLGPIRIKIEDGIEFGPFQTDGQLWDQYPFWSCFITFKIEVSNVVNSVYDDFL